MKIFMPMDRRDEIEAVVKTLAGIRPAEHGSPGYEIPVIGHKHKGRVHIMFASDGVEVHRDQQMSGQRHKVMSQSATAKLVFEELKEKLKNI